MRTEIVCRVSVCAVPEISEVAILRTVRIGERMSEVCRVQCSLKVG